MNATTPGRLKRLRSMAGVLVCLGGVLGLAPAVHAAGWLDSIFGKSSAQAEAAKAGSRQRLWRIREFSTVALVPREPGSAENQQPVKLSPDALRQQLAQIQSVGRSAAPEPLFAADELAELIEPLAQALERAGPGDDVLLVSASRRDGGVLTPPTAVTARLFVKVDQLQLIVHDARLDFYDTYRGTNLAPRFTFGSRTVASEASLRSAGASNTRADWLSIPMRVAAAAPPAAAATAAPPVAAPAMASPAPATQPPTQRKPLDAQGAEDIERRLETLKRLREKGLISEEEYQQKRKEILQLL